MGNSVIYRPAYEAEVKYLESDGNSYIDTGLRASSELGILAHIQCLNNLQWLFGGANGLEDKAFSFIIYNAPASSYRYGNRKIELSSGLSLNTTYEFDNIQNHNVMKVGSLTYTATASTFTSDYNFYLFTENRNGKPNTASSGVRIYDFKIYQNSTLVRDFIPVRIGQVGYMYDKVSKQLFANKGTGNFILGNDVSNAVIPQQRCVLYFGSQRSVIYERIYEEYEWLCGDGQAYINTKVGDLSDVDYITCYLSAVDVYTENRIFGREGTTYTRIVSSYDGVQNGISLWIGNISQGLLAFPTKEGRLTINIVDEIASTDDDSLSFVTPTDLNGRNFYLFGDNGYNKIFSGKIKSFEIDKKINLVPCKLLQPIPSILDGNGIARQAGECGMWDKVSNRFYGNVENSGTFTVSN